MPTGSSSSADRSSGGPTILDTGQAAPPRRPFPSAYDGGRGRSVRSGSSVRSSSGSRIPTSVGSPGNTRVRGGSRGNLAPSDRRVDSLGGVIDRYSPGGGAGTRPSGPSDRVSGGNAYRPGNRTGVGRPDATGGGERGDGGEGGVTRPGNTRGPGGLRNVGGSRNVRATENVRSQAGGGVVANPGGGSTVRPGGGDARPGGGNVRNGGAVRGGADGRVGGGYGAGVGAGDRTGNVNPGAGVTGPTASRGDDYRNPGTLVRGGGYTRGAGDYRINYNDPRYPAGTAYFGPWGYFRPNVGFSYNFGWYCGSSYWYWNLPSYYCWYWPYRFRYSIFPSVFVGGGGFVGGFNNNPAVIYIEDDDPDVIYIDDNDDVVFVDEPVGEAVVQAGEGGIPLDVPAEPEPLNLAAERYLDLGDQAFRDGRFADAVHFYAKAIEFTPGSGVLYLVLADALFATGDYHYAAYAVRKALELDPSLVESAVDKHGFYSDPAEFDRQLAVLENFVFDHPGDADARLVLAVNLLFGNRPADAVDLLRGAQAQRGDRRAETLVLQQAEALQYGPR